MGALGEAAGTRPFSPWSDPSWQVTFGDDGSITYEPLSSEEAARRVAAAAGPADWVWGTLLDFFNDIVEGPARILSNTWTGVQEAVQVIVDGVEEAYQFVVDTVDEAIIVVEGFIKQVVTDVDKFVQFLSYLFEWDDIVATHKVIAAQVTSFFTGVQTWLAGQVQSGEKTINAWFQAREEDIAGYFDGIIASLQADGGTPSSFQAQGNPSAVLQPNGQDITPQSSWLVNKVYANADATLLGAPAAPRAASDPADPYFTAVAGFIDSVKSLLASSTDPALTSLPADLSDALTSFGDLFTDPGGFLSQEVSAIIAVVRDVIVGLMRLANGVVDGFVTLISSVVSGIVEYLTAPLATAIPFVTSFYASISGGSQLSLLDLLCLVAAVPTTIVYKILYGASPPSPGALAAADGTMTQFLAIVYMVITVPLIGFWIAQDVTGGMMPKLSSKLALAASAITYAISFALSEQQWQDYLLTVLQLIPILLGVYVMKMVDPADLAVWQQDAPFIFCAYGLGMMLVYGGYAGLWPDAYDGPHHYALVMNIFSALPYFGQPLAKLPSWWGKAAIAVCDMIGYVIAAVMCGLLYFDEEGDAPRSLSS